jgi:hypothetical protein
MKRHLLRESQGKHMTTTSKKIDTSSQGEEVARQNEQHSRSLWEMSESGRLCAITLLQQKANALAEERSRLAAIVESSNDAIVGKTLAGIITNWNCAASGASVGETPERRRFYLQFLPTSSVKQGRNYLEALRPDIEKRHITAFEKPFDLDAFLLTVQGMIGKARSEKRA